MFYIKKDSTSQILEVFLRDSTTGLGKTGVAAASMSGGYCESNSSETSLSFSSGSVGDAYSSGKWAEVGNGRYLYHAPNGAFDSYGRFTMRFAASGVVDRTISFQVGAIDIQDATRMGLTALPNANAGAAGGLPTDSTGKTSFNDIAATAIVSGGAITTSGGAVSTVTTVGSVTGNVGGSVGSISGVTFPTNFAALGINVSGHISGLANGVITSGVIADDAITASKVATDAVTEIAGQVWEEAYADHTTAGTFGKLLDTIRKANLSTDGVVSSGLSTTVFYTDLTDTDSTHNHKLLVFTDGPLNGVSRPVDVYTQTNGQITLQEPLPSIPSNGDSFSLLVQHIHPISEFWSYDNRTLTSAANITSDSGVINTTSGVVDNVTLVDTTTINTDMRGTDGANTVAPLSDSETRSAVGLASADLDTQLASITASIEEIKGSGWATTDTLEAIRDAISGIDSGTGSGSRVVVLKVTDGTDPLQNVKVRMYLGVENYVGTTDANGLVTFGLENDGTWNVLVSKTGYDSIVTTLAVSTDIDAGSQVYELDQIVVTTPSDPAYCRVSTYVYYNGSPEQNATFKAKLQTRNITTDGIIVSQNESATTNASGYAYLDLIRLDQIADGNGKYELELWNSRGNLVFRTSSTIPNSGNVNLEDLI